jgi:hypothetical protein
MAEAVQTIAAVERRPAGDVLADLAMPPGDVLRVRIDGDTFPGTLPLEEGLRLFAGARDLLLAAVCSARQPRAYYPRRQELSLARPFLSACRLGQTGRDGYAVTILVPVPPTVGDAVRPEENGDEGAQEPFERRVTWRLMQGLQTIQAAIAANRPEEILRGIPTGVSANLCEALARMCPSASQASLEVSVTWSRTRTRVPQRVPGRVTFAQGEFSLIREAGRQLSAAGTPRRARIEGLVVGLCVAPDGAGEPLAGQMIVQAMVEGRPAQVRCFLGQAEYARACEAHRDRLRVKVAGVLQAGRRGGAYVLTQPEGFQVVADEPAAT